MRTLYYVEKPEVCTMTENVLTELQQVQVYEIFNNKPVPLFEIELDLFGNSEMAILEYLDDNGMGDTQINLIEL